jgi:hypothetical protein
VEWSCYDATEKFNVGVYLVPIADRAEKISSGTRTIDFEPVTGRLYRLQWTPLADSPEMSITLVDSGMRPVNVG